MCWKPILHLNKGNAECSALAGITIFCLPHHTLLRMVTEQQHKTIHLDDRPLPDSD
jgi:hypothetical protein